MDVAVSLTLPREVEEQFLPLEMNERQDLLTQLLIDWADKQIRKKRREELLKNLSPEIERWAGVLKKSNGKSYKDEELDQIKYDFLMEKYG